MREDMQAQKSKEIQSKDPPGNVVRACMRVCVLYSPSCCLMDSRTIRSYSCKNRSVRKMWRGRLGSTDRIVVPIELATVNVRAALEVRFWLYKLPVEARG